jgi:hypothetical protein
MPSIFMLNGFIPPFIPVIPFSCASCAMLSPLGMPRPGEVSPRLNLPTPVPRFARAACWCAAATRCCHRRCRRNDPRCWRGGALGTGQVTAAAAAISQAATGTSRRGTWDTTDAWHVLTREEIAVVAVHAVIGDAIVDGGRAAAVAVHVALGGPADRRGTGRCRRHIGRSTWRWRGRLFSRARSVVVCRRRLLEHGQERRIHHARSCRPWQGIVRRGWHCHRGGESGKQGCQRGRRKSVLCGLDVNMLCGRVMHSATRPSELTPAHVPHSASLVARAGADIRCAALLAALSLARS